MTAKLVWMQGGEASLVSLNGETLEVLSSRPFAPGSRPEGTLESPGAKAPHRVWLKVHNARRQNDGTFRIVGRLLNVTREVREVLKEAVSSSNGAKSPTS